MIWEKNFLATIIMNTIALLSWRMVSITSWTILENVFKFFNWYNDPSKDNPDIESSQIMPSKLFLLDGGELLKNFCEEVYHKLKWIIIFNKWIIALNKLMASFKNKQYNFIWNESIFWHNSSVIRQKGESQNGCFKKTKHEFRVMTSMHRTLERWKMKRNISHSSKV